MKDILKIGSAFIGIIVGAAFASGQEILQYFTSFGLIGSIGAIISTAIFAYCGMVLVWLGSRTKATSHKEVIYQVSGRLVGTIIDYVLIFTLFGMGILMIAGAGASLHQQFALPYFVGSLIMTLLVFVSSLFNTSRVVSIISSVSPFLIILIIIISVYTLVTLDSSFASLNKLATAVETPSSLPNWFVSSLNYACMNLTLGASMAIISGSTIKDPKIAAFGGLAGGLGLGILIQLVHFAIFIKIEEVATLDMPLLGIINEISPILGTIMSIVIFGMIFNTTVSVVYGFVARLAQTGTKKFNVILVIALISEFGLSFIGFTGLVSSFLPLVGYLGVILIVALIIAPFRLKKNNSDSELNSNQSKDKLA
ncbi:hypothetical protein [Pallidibacillus thermolactis]|jgi:uncharacterized membrane protein YkvI|uniref:YkvI family membrane protein n=1 Tax=Pallidibacillus thermolactis TaxID=251051 RepID=UPI0021DACC9F|nr:hypothetical protein [Pallidibacillus thermolactis]MCU9601922.1 hypothetical protein [Pallidibacillus thermolactis subsp. kokeshiiformis]MED1674956.1 hypothetical protein [Pallidibacillus thermolactis subsp. kokeshiiformis]